ncbi:protein-L-isoaspartate O-methyltransferase [Bartonella sp. TP]|uniref:protein-L-isoaspartate O-methyltransferase family protein n=1 Tax=Bartonella sp. TP TaxID=3057550 RepID=UPI0025B27B09|nr:protein-L-isoaspartate O-methyltransferase [Bartonella sp. TP]MDN5249454.1 protein-L-isoaspartate O-methyltransferase [Alphaproteobacteria bacterium]WJW79797.1 protein-L-isoaspartate O-methyltransferase [Bartonella sp. TP]
MSVDFLTFRINMVNNQLRTVDITDPCILNVFSTTRREDFVPANMADLAYIDEDIRLVDVATARYLMEPGPLAKLLQLAAVKKTDSVLHIGAATGYATEIISKLAEKVIAVEEEPSLLSSAAKILEQHNCNNVIFIGGQLTAGCEREGPFDVIFIEGAVDFVPNALFEQLKENGRLIVVEGNYKNGVAKLYLKENGVVSSRVAFNLNVKELPGFARPEAYAF